MFLQFHMSNIEAFLKELEELLLDSACPASTYYYAIEPVLKEQEEELIQHGYSSINVDMFTGQEAILKIIDAYKDMYVFDETPQKSRRFVQKHPGFVVATKNKREIIACIEKINNEKKAFRAAVVKSSDDAYEKWQNVHDRFNYLITTSAYRTIYAFKEDVHRVNFNWVSRPLHKAYTLEELKQKIDKGVHTVPLSYSRQSWLEKLEHDKSLLDAHQSAEFAVKRRIKLRPESSIRLEDAEKAKGYAASLPYVFFSPPKYHTHLSSLIAPRHVKIKENVGDGWVLINRRMNLYKRNIK